MLLSQIKYSEIVINCVLTYQMQICLGLEICDAELSMIEALAMAARHDKFWRRLRMPTTHHKLQRFCMTKQASLLLLMQHRFSRNARHASQVPLLQTQTYLHLI